MSSPVRGRTRRTMRPCFTILEARTGRNRDRRVGLAGVFVADVLDEQQDEDVILVLAGVHAATELVAAGPEGGVELGFLERHVYIRQPKGRCSTVIRTSGPDGRAQPSWDSQRLSD